MFRQPTSDDLPFLESLRSEHVGGVARPESWWPKTLFIVERDGKSVAYAGLMPSHSEVLEMELLCVVAPDSRMRRLGHDACMAVLTWGIARSGRVLASVKNDNATGLSLARCLGLDARASRAADETWFIAERDWLLRVLTFFAFRDQCIWLRICYNTFAALFEHEHRPEDLLSRTAPQFFTDLNHVLREYCWLQTCRLTDKATSYSPRAKGEVENLTVAHLNALLSKAGRLSKSVSDAADGMMRYRAFIEPARSGLIAHADKALILAGASMGTHDAAEVEAFFEHMQTYCDEVGRAVGVGPSDFRSLPSSGDTWDLVACLRAGLEAESGS